MQIAYYLENVGKLITSRQGVTCLRLNQKEFPGFVVEGKFTVMVVNAKMRMPGHRNCGCKFRNNDCKWLQKWSKDWATTEQSWTPTLYSMFSFFPLMAERFGVLVLLPLQPKTVSFFSVFLSTLSFLACICIHSRQIYLASTMPGLGDATIKHTCTYVLAHPQTCTHLRVNPSLHKIYILVEEDRQFLESSIK